MAPPRKARPEVLRAGPGAVVPALVLLAAVHGALPWLLPLAPGQDTPQHLAYARILEGLRETSSPLAATYERAPPHVYHLVHHVLAFVGRGVGTLAAGRALFSVYAVAMVVAFTALNAELARAEAEEGARSLPGGLLVAFVVWSPVAWMGFLSYLLAVPAVLGAYAAYRRTLRTGSAVAVGVAAALAAAAGALHPVAGAAMALLVVLASVFDPEQDRRRALASALVVGLVALAPTVVTVALDAANAAPAAARPFDGLAMDLGSPFAKLEHVLVAFVGVLPSWGKLVTGAALGALVVLGGAPVRRKRWVVPAAFLILAMLAPATLARPVDMAFVDYRLVTLAVTVLLAHGTLPRLRHRPAAAIGAAALATAVWALTFVGLRREQDVYVRLLAGLGAQDRLLALPIADASAFLDDGNTEAHYWPLLHTLATGGVTSSFWGRFSPHLPVGYRPGAALAAPPDWRPWELTPAHLAGATHVLLVLPTDAEGPWADLLEGLRRTLLVASDAVTCEGAACLFTLSPRAVTPAGPVGDRGF